MKVKTSQIVSIVSLSIVGLLILAVILLAVIPTYKGAVFANSSGTFSEADKPDTITVRTNTDKEKEVVYYKANPEDKEMYDKLWNAYIDAGSYAILDTLFIGFAGKHAYPERTSAYSSAMSTLFDSSDEYCMVFTWAEPRDMMNADGTPFKYTVGSATYTPDQYSRAYISITADNVIKNTSVYLLTAQKDFKSGTTRYVYNAYLNTSNLYKIVSDLDDLDYSAV